MPKQPFQVSCFLCNLKKQFLQQNSLSKQTFILNTLSILLCSPPAYTSVSCNISWCCERNESKSQTKYCFFSPLPCQVFSLDKYALLAELIADQAILPSSANIIQPPQCKQHSSTTQTSTDNLVLVLYTVLESSAIIIAL